MQAEKKIKRKLIISRIKAIVMRRSNEKIYRSSIRERGLNGCQVQE